MGKNKEDDLTKRPLIPGPCSGTGTVTEGNHNQIEMEIM